MCRSRSGWTKPTSRPQYVRDYIVARRRRLDGREGAPLGRAAACHGRSAASSWRCSTTSGCATSQRVELLRRAAPLRAHARRDPLTEFKIEAFHLFELMLAPAPPQRDGGDHARRLRGGGCRRSRSMKSRNYDVFVPTISSARCTEPDGDACSAGHQPRNGRSAAAPSGCGRCGSGTGSAPRSA